VKLVLHNYWRSSASHRVRIALHYKELAFDYVAVNIRDGEQHSAVYRAKNPMAFVPTLEVVEDGKVLTLTQSLPILEYLEERWPARALLPKDPYLRARSRALAEIVNSGIQPMQNLATAAKLKTHGVDGAEWARHFIASGLAAFAKLAAETAGTFCVGDAPTLADCCLVPQLGAARRYNVDLAPFPQLVAIEEHCLALPAFTAAAPDRQLDAVKA